MDTQDFTITLDIAGLNYGVKLTYPDDTLPKTVKEVMDAAEMLGSAGAPVTGVNLSSDENGDPLPLPKLVVTPQAPIGGRIFLRKIEVTHVGNSGQSRQAAERLIPDGVYGFADDPATIVDAGGGRQRLRAVDSDNEVIEDKTSILAWQYYIYSSDFVDKNRAAGGVKRQVVPYTEADQSQDITLAWGDTIVWRMVLIAVAATDAADDPGQAVTLTSQMSAKGAAEEERIKRSDRT